MIISINTYIQNLLVARLLLRSGRHKEDDYFFTILYGLLFHKKIFFCYIECNLLILRDLIMKNTTKRDLLIKELLAVTTQAIHVYIALKSKTLSPELKKHLDDIDDIIDKISELKKMLRAPEHLTTNALRKHCNDLRQKAQQEKYPFLDYNILSEDRSWLEAIQTTLTYAVRAILRVVDCILSLSFENTYNNNGETPLALNTRNALGLTSRSQFFPRPITSVNEATDEVKNVSLHLEQCLSVIEKEQKDEDANSDAAIRI